MMDRASGPIAPMPEVVLEIRQGPGRSTTLPLTHVDFLIGTVPGCDLRVPGAELPPVLCLLARRPGGVSLRKLAPTQVILINGQVANHAELNPGDRLTVGAIDILIQIQAATAPVPVAKPADDGRMALLERREQQLEEKSRQFEREKQLWQEKKLAPAPAASSLMPSEREAALALQESELERERDDFAKARSELAEIRKQLYDRYQERRDRLAGLQEAVDRAAKKVQDQKRELHAGEQKLRQERQETEELREANIQQAREISGLAERVEMERKAFQQRQDELESQASQIAVSRAELDSKLKQYDVDVLRLDRRQGQLEEREQAVEKQTQEFEARVAQLRKTSDELEEQVLHCEKWGQELQGEADRLNRQKEEQESLAQQLSQRTAAVEGQQATLAALRTRLERTREDLRRQEQEIEEQRQRQTKAAEEIEVQLQEIQRLRADLTAEQEVRESERTQLLERQAVLNAAVQNLQQAQTKFAEDDRRLLLAWDDLERRGREQMQREGEWESRLAQVAEAQERLDAERQALRERTQALAQAEQVREALQEQLRKRGEEIAAKQKSLVELDEKLRADAAQAATDREEVDRLKLEAQDQIRLVTRELELQTQAVEKQRAELLEREEQQRRQLEQLKDAGRDVAGQRQNLAEEREQLRSQLEQAQAEQERLRKEYDGLKKEVQHLVQKLPDVELKAGERLDQLAHAREQLRDHLNEVHQYVRQCHEGIEGLHERVRGDIDLLRNREAALRVQQDEHRLSLAEVKQRMIDWQGQVGSVERHLSHDETRLDRRMAQVEEKAKKLDAATATLARQAEELEEAKQAVQERRVEIDRHLGDMRQWYRGKLRELVGFDQAAPAKRDVPLAPVVAALDGEEEALIPIGRHILSMTDPVDPGDQILGESLQRLELVDADTLTALLAEARRQRRSLRQVLLQSGAITLYQLAVIEAGDVDALMLGPVRIIDRLKATPHEVIYRVFDPRHGREAMLRHLTEASAQDPMHPDEYRQRFAQAQLTDPHLAAPYEILEVGGRPAVLTELCTGLASTDWPPLAAVPGVCFRLLTQAALGLARLHREGLVHGHLDENAILLDAEGFVKILGIGEPPWLWPQDSGESSAHADLAALGRLAAGWCSPTAVRRGAKAKPLPEGLTRILQKMQAAPEDGYATASELLEDLDRIGDEVPANAEAWDRLVRHVKEHAGSAAAVRKTA